MAIPMAQAIKDISNKTLKEFNGGFVLSIKTNYPENWEMSTRQTQYFGFKEKRYAKTFSKGFLLGPIGPNHLTPWPKPTLTIWSVKEEESGEFGLFEVME